MKQKRQRRRPMSFRSIAVRVICLTLALWVCFMAVLTEAVAMHFLQQVNDKADEWALTKTHYQDINTELPGAREVEMINDLGNAYIFPLDRLLPIALPHRPSTYGDDDWIWGKWDLLYGYEVAKIFYDENGAPLIKSQDYLTLKYIKGNHWETGNVTIDGYCYVALDEVAGGEALGRFSTSHPSGMMGWGDGVLRMTGYFEANQFFPTLVEYGDYYGYNSHSYAENRFGSKEAMLNYQDLRHDHLEWQELLRSDADPTQPLETIYGLNPEGIQCDFQSVTANGTEFSDLTELLRTDIADLDTDYTRLNLFDSLIIAYPHNENQRCAIVIRCWPLEYAFYRLIPAYLVSLTVIGLALWLILWKIHRKLTSPLLDIATATATGREITPSDGWWEPYQIQKYLCETRQTLTDTNVRLKQTETALEYAHHAEENRKQLISNLTHELKTPLAIIHSYTEGLMEGIAEDKREQYLSVILEQSERMDALVLQMLDLSRLEAGKVRLTMEPVALLRLTQAVTDRFAPLLAEKKLTLRYDMVEDLTVPADEARMEQVITNLVSNAVKYSPPGGTIWLNLYLFSGQVHFFIGNTAPHLSDEALEKVWDSFYRADPSRTEPGTGLGLALVKGIVSLHRGECTVRNTSAEGQSAVEFGFTLPVH